jgi:hypothetical protein
MVIYYRYIIIKSVYHNSSLHGTCIKWIYWINIKILVSKMFLVDIFLKCLFMLFQISSNLSSILLKNNIKLQYSMYYCEHLLWAYLTKIYPPLSTSVQPISITKNERDPPLFTGKLLIKFQNILRKTTQVIIQHRVKFLFSIISSPITLERQKWKSSKMKGILLFTSKQLIKF